ncbi:MAG: hypothetical protein ACLGGX_06180 [Bdellovibrionia bacterium]
MSPSGPTPPAWRRPAPQEMGYVPQGSGVSLAQYYFLLLAMAVSQG